MQNRGKQMIWILKRKEKVGAQKSQPSKIRSNISVQICCEKKIHVE